MSTSRSTYLSRLGVETSARRIAAIAIFVMKVILTIPTGRPNGSEDTYGKYERISTR
jgi:hypothetical protein